MGVISDGRAGAANTAPALPTAVPHQPYRWTARRFWPALSLVVAGAMVAVGYFGRRVFLWSDDYVFLADARGRSLTWDQLKVPLFGHFSPVSQFTDVLVAAALPEHPGLIRGILLFLSLSVVAAVAFLFTGLFGRTWAAIIGTALAAPALALLGPVNWWTAGVNMMPAFAGVAVCLGATVRLVRGGSPWWALPAVAAFAVAVLALELGVTAFGYAVLWTLLFRGRVSGERWSDLLRRTWWWWLALGVIAAWSVLNYKQNYYTPTPAPSGSQAFDALFTSLFTMQLPLTLGFYDPSRPAFRELGIAVGAIALIVLLVVTMLRSRRAWRGWAFALLGWLLPVLAVVLSRVGYIGVPAVEQPMYYFLPTLMVVVGVLEAWAAPWAPPAGAPETDGGPPTADRNGPPARPATLVAGAVVAVGLVLAWLSSAWPTISSTNYGMIGPANSVERTYMTNLVDSAHALQATGESFSIINQAGMDALVNFQGHNRLSQLTAVHDPTIPFDAPHGPWYVPDTTGILAPATINWSAELAPVVPADLTVAGITPTGSGSGFCFTVDSPTAIVRWDLDTPIGGGPLVIRTMASVQAATPVRVSTVTNPGDEPVATNVNPRAWTADEAGRLDTTPEPQISSVVIDAMAVGTSMCIDSIEVGTVSMG